MGFCVSCSHESASEAGAAAAVPTALPEPAAEDYDDEHRWESEKKIEHGRAAIIFFLIIIFNVHYS